MNCIVIKAEPVFFHQSSIFWEPHCATAVVFLKVTRKLHLFDDANVCANMALEEWHETVKNAHHSFPEQKVSASNCLFLSDKHFKTQKYSVQKEREREEQQILTFVKLKPANIYRKTNQQR